MDCPLCRLARGLDRYTKPFYEDDKVVITTCKTCLVPLGVIKQHGQNATFEIKDHIKKKMWELFPNTYIDETQRTIKDHWHVHSRKLK